MGSSVPGPCEAPSLSSSVGPRRDSVFYRGTRKVTFRSCSVKGGAQWVGSHHGALSRSWCLVRSSPSRELSTAVPVCALWLMLTLPSSPWVKATENRTAFHIVCVCVCESLSFVTPWTVVHHSSLSMEFSRQEYWSGLPIPYPEDLPDPGIEPESSALQVVSLPSEPSGKPTPHDSHPQLPICFFSYLGVVYKTLSWSDTSLSKGSFLFWCQAGLCLLIPMRAEGKPVSFPYWEGTHSLRFYTFSLVTPAGFPELAGSLSLVMPVPLQDIPSLALRDTFPPDSALLDRVLQIYPWNKITGRKKERDWCHWDQYLHIYHRGGKAGLWEKSMVKILDSGFKSWPC